MAGLGRKTWANEILAQPDLQGYLQDQVVMRFANAAARTAAIPAPTEGMVSWLDDLNRGYVYDGAAWLWAFGDPEPPAVTAWPGAPSWGVTSGYASPGYFRDRSGVVHGSGALKWNGGTVGSGTAMSTALPAAFRPTATLPLSLLASVGTGVIRADVSTGGIITCLSNLSNGAIVFLDSMVYNPATLAVAP